MENIYGYDYSECGGIDLQGMCSGVRSAVKTTFLAYRIRRQVENGLSMEEVVQGYLPASDEEKIREAVEQMEAGVADVYGAMDEEVNEQWIEQHLNVSLGKLSVADRVSHLMNIIDLVDSGSITEDAREKVDEIRHKDTVTDEDAAVLLDVAKRVIPGSAGVLKRGSVQAMDKSMHVLPKETISEISTIGVDTAKAYAAACYILQQKKDKPWNVDVKDQLPYAIGTTAAANIESSRLMALYHSGKIKLAVLHERLQKLFTVVITLVSDHITHVFAVGLQALVIAKMTAVIFRFLVTRLYFGPWVSLIGAAVVSLYTGTRIITTQDFTDMLNTVWRVVRTVWSQIRNMFASALHLQDDDIYQEIEDEDEEEEEDEDEDTEETVDAESEYETDEEDMDDEDDEDNVN